MWQKLKAFHETIQGYLFFGVLELAILYGISSLAIDRGNLLYYLLALVFLYGVLENLVGFLKLSGKAVRHGYKPAKARRH